MLILKRKILMRSTKPKVLEDAKKEVQRTLGKMSTMDRLLYTGADTGLLVALALGGAYVSKLVGRPALYTGLAITGLGCFINQPLVAASGVGLMAGGALQPKGEPTIFGSNSGETFKQKSKEFGKQLLHNSYFSELMSSESPEPEEQPADPAQESVSGLGTVPELDFSVFSDLEQELVDTARATPISTFDQPSEDVAQFDLSLI